MCGESQDKQKSPAKPGFLKSRTAPHKTMQVKESSRAALS